MTQFRLDPSFILFFPLLGCAAPVEGEDFLESDKATNACVGETCTVSSTIPSEDGPLIHSVALGPGGLSLFDEIGWEDGTLILSGKDGDIRYRVPFTAERRQELARTWTSTRRSTPRATFVIERRGTSVACTAALVREPRLVDGRSYLPMSWVEMLSADNGLPFCLIAKDRETSDPVRFDKGKHGRSANGCVASGGDIEGLPMRDCRFRRTQ